MLTSDSLDSPSPPKPPKKPRKLQPSFQALIGLTFLTALLLLPFVFSRDYLDLLRANAVDLHHLLRGELYKQITGYLGLVFALFEMILTIRKRGRGWFVRINLPGAMVMWRSLHIFAGVGMLAMISVHTLGATGFNFNAIFLWVFFAVTLTAVIGVVAETGIIESPRRQFGKLPWMQTALAKGPLIKSLRGLWFNSHVFFVVVFFVMLVMHSALVYYYQ